MIVRDLLESEQDPFKPLPATPEQLGRQVSAYLHMYYHYSKVDSDKTATPKKRFQASKHLEKLRTELMSVPSISLPRESLFQLLDFIKDEKNRVVKAVFNLGTRYLLVPTGPEVGRFLNYNMFKEESRDVQREYFCVFDSDSCSYYARYADKNASSVQVMSSFQLQLTQLDQMSSRISKKPTSS